MYDEMVSVWGKRYPVTVYQKSKSVWIASGTYMDEHKQTKGSTMGAALKRWREWAEYKGG